MSADQWIEHYRFAKLTTDSITNRICGIREARRIATAFIGEQGVQLAEARGGTLAERKAEIARAVGVELTERAAAVRASSLAHPAPQLVRPSAPPADGFDLSA